MQNYHSHFIGLLIQSLVLSVCTFENSSATVIDDFSFAQEGISTDQFAEFDTIEFVSPIGDYRELWGGGASVEGNCDHTEMTVAVAGGTFSVANGPDCYGAGNVRWGGAEDSDISHYDAFSLEVAEITGAIDIRISISKNLLGARRIDAVIDHTGEHRFRFEDFDNISGQPFGLDEVRSLNISLLVEAGEFVALDSVSLVVPEPACNALALLCIFLVAKFRGMSAANNIEIAVGPSS